MGFFNKLLKRNKEKSIENYSDFWDWFVTKEKDFYEVVKEAKHFEKKFFDILSPKLDELREGIFFLSGMLDENTAELILTPEGRIKNISIVEELVAAAPEIKGWKFTALKPEWSNDGMSINMDGYSFSLENISFYSNEDKYYPDEIDITIVHNDYNEENKNIVGNGTYIFLDNFLGELNSISIIDNLSFIEPKNAEKELVPIEKLKDFLIWREKEFIEKYEGLRHNTENDNYTMYESELENGDMIFAVINADLLNWDSTASHPWMVCLTIKFDGSKSNGMPDDKTFEILNEIEDNLTENLKDIDGYLNLGRETSNGEREIFIACKEFRKPTIYIPELINKYKSKIEINYEIYKDKYWKTLSRYTKN